MDLGTMTTKAHRGKYRSLEDFAVSRTFLDGHFSAHAFQADFRLVTSNAKLFNPPGSIYHIEADRLEVWGIDHISKAAATVIQYETDWNIDIEKEDEGANVEIEDEDDYNPSVDMARDLDTPSKARSPSVVSQSLPGRRTTRAAFQKKPENPAAIKETIDGEGRLPGSKDGLGAFPAGSDWAKTMLALKLKGMS